MPKEYNIFNLIKLAENKLIEPGRIYNISSITENLSDLKTFVTS